MFLSSSQSFNAWDERGAGAQGLVLRQPQYGVVNDQIRPRIVEFPPPARYLRSEPLTLARSPANPSVGRSGLPEGARRWPAKGRECRRTRVDHLVVPTDVPARPLRTVGTPLSQESEP
jgi:hypothetical protein